MRHRRLTVSLLVVLGLIGLGEIGYSTRWGPGVGGDATIYIFSARNLLAGHGLGLLGPSGEFRLLPYSAPLFPLLLSLFGLLGMELVAAARWLNAFLFAATVLLVGLTSYRYTRASWLSLAASALVLTSPILVPVYSWAMSEPVFLFTGFLGLVLVLRFLERRTAGALLAAALASGLALLTRYIGVAFVATGALCLFLLGSGRWRRKLSDTVVFLFVACAPMAVWASILFLNTGTVASRGMESLQGLMGRLASFLLSLRDVVLSWLLPYSWLTALPYPTILKPILVILLAVALGGLIVVTILRVRERAPQRWLDDGRMRFGLAILVFAIIYVGTAGLVFLFTYPPITVDNRMFSPVHLAIIILFSDVVHLVSSSGSRGWLTLVSVGLIVGMTASFTLRGPRIVLQLHRDGLGYTSPAWQESETIQAVRGLSPDVAIITNEVTAVLFLTGRSAYPLAEIYQSRPLARYTRYGDDTSDNTQKVFRERGAALVLFGTIEGQLRELYGDRTGERLRVLTKGLFEYFRGRDGAIYRYSPPPEGP